MNCKHYIENGTCLIKPKNYLGLFSQECIIKSNIELCKDWEPKSSSLNLNELKRLIKNKRDLENAKFKKY